MQFASACLIGLVIGAPGWAQLAASEFDVASVKQLDQSIEPGRPDLSFVGTSGKLAKIEGNRVTLKGTLRAFIAAAYDVKDYQISAAPPWADVLIHAIDAKTAGDAAPTQEQVRPMLQSLLADRFQLKLHRETKELPVYHLTQGKKNIGLKPAAPGESFGWDVGLSRQLRLMRTN